MITTLYAGVLGLLYVCLSGWVVMGRYQHRVSLGDGGNDALSRRIRVHGNFAEYVPFALLLIFLVDSMKTDPVIIHALGVMLVAGRLLHAWALTSSGGPSIARAGGMILTFLVFIVCGIVLIWNFFAMSATGVS